jgi:hypothetical protein
VQLTMAQNWFEASLQLDAIHEQCIDVAVGD